MDKYNCFYNGYPIRKHVFDAGVPKNWQSEVENNEYSRGYFRAVKIEE